SDQTPCIGIETNDVVDWLIWQRYRVEHDFRFGKWQRRQDAIARRLRRRVGLHRTARILAIALIIRKEQEPISQDGPAERSSELVEPDLWFGGRAGQEWIARRESLMLEILEQRAVKLVRARSRDHVHLAANRPAVLGREDAFDDLHSGPRCSAQDLDVVRAAVVAKAAVLGVGLRAGAVDVDGAPTVADAVHAEGPAASEGVIGRTDTRG